MRVVSPPRPTKRARENDDDFSRRVAQRPTPFESSFNPARNFVFQPTMMKLIKKLNMTDDLPTLQTTMSDLVRLLYRKDGVDVRPKLQESWFNAGGHLAVVTTMTKHFDSPLLLQDGIRALTNATCDNQRLKVVVSEIGGIEVVCQAMKRHSEDKETQRLSLKALNNLLHKKEHGKAFVEDMNGCTAIINAMNQFCENVCVIEKACAVLLKLSWLKKLRQQMLDANVDEALRLALERHGDEEKIQSYGGTALAALTSGSGEGGDDNMAM